MVCERLVDVVSTLHNLIQWRRGDAGIIYVEQLTSPNHPKHLHYEKHGLHTGLLGGDCPLILKSPLMKLAMAVQRAELVKGVGLLKR